MTTMQTSTTAQKEARKTLTSVPKLAQGRAWGLDSGVRATQTKASYFRCLPSILPLGSHARSGLPVVLASRARNTEGEASFS